MEITVAGLTDVGLQREHNEDSFAVLEEYDLFVVADGMGGHRAGDIASRTATEAMGDFYRATKSEETTWPFHFDPNLSVEENRLVTSIKVANRRIFDASSRNSEVRGMGTTVVAIAISRKQNRAYVAHVGDSRCYRVRNGEISQITRDHSLLNDYLLVMPDMTQEQQNELPKNVITRALGMQDAVVVDLVAEKVQNEDVFLLCSDGLSGMLDDSEMLEIVVQTAGDLEAAAKKLIEAANANGGEDNITAVLVSLSGVSETDVGDTENLGKSRSIGPLRDAEDPVATAATLEMDARQLPSEEEHQRAKAPANDLADMTETLELNTGEERAEELESLKNGDSDDTND
ncbi:MAG: Stp1/IreP family PP2C-type Ser/Thr phosphatase [Myxococcales bacterium]|nr:Stp1/IreP family PP2C-type Ser/Thr phosphatase [Myxococcales bacterium]